MKDLYNRYIKDDLHISHNDYKKTLRFNKYKLKSNQKMVNVIANIVEYNSKILKYNGKFTSYDEYELDTYNGKLELCDSIFLTISDYIIKGRWKKAIKLAYSVSYFYPAIPSIIENVKSAILWYKYKL